MDIIDVGGEGHTLRARTSSKNKDKNLNPDEVY